MRRWIAVMAALCMGFLMGMPAAWAERDTVVVASVNYTEELIFGHILKELVQNRTDYKVELKEGLGSEIVSYQAMAAGEIDACLEYTGTVYGAILGLPNDESVDMYAVCRERLRENDGLECLDLIGFNNTYCMAMKREDAEKYGIRKISDLIGLGPKFVFAPSFAFMEREDGLKKLLRDYEGIDFAEITPLEGSLKYVSAMSGQVDIVLAFSTDGLLQKYDMVVLEDDRNSMFHYDAFVMARADALERFPGLADALNCLAGSIPDEEMSRLNYLVDVEQYSPEEVARDFLKERGLI